MIEYLEDDGLVTPEIKYHTLKKYALIEHYSQQFARAMKVKWDCRVYIDLFAGAGRSKIAGTEKIVHSSAFLALGVTNPFDKYIFCEMDSKKIDALKIRVEREYSQLNTCLIEGDSNSNIDRIIREIPDYSSKFRILSFCLVDPYKIDSLKFNTIVQLSKLYVDFMVLIPTHMDITRNPLHYLKEGNMKVEHFLGNPNWRGEYSKYQTKNLPFWYYVFDEFGRQMAKLGFKNKGIKDAKEICQADRKITLYYLAFYSRHALGMKFWRDAIKGTDPQMSLFD